MSSSHGSGKQWQQLVTTGHSYTRIKRAQVWNNQRRMSHSSSGLCTSGKKYHTLLLRLRSHSHATLHSLKSHEEPLLRPQCKTKQSKSCSVLGFDAELRNVSHARQRLKVEHNQQEHLIFEPEEEYMSSSHIRGLSITPGGRLLVAHSVRHLSNHAF